MERHQIKLQFETTDKLEEEFETHLRNGGTFVDIQEDAAVHDPCDVILVHPANGAEKRMPAKIVLIVDQGENTGMGLAFNAFDATQREEISAFIEDNKKPGSDSANLPPDNENATQNRYMSEIQRCNIARYGEIGERIQLERRYGKLVWELLLRNPMLSKPEVARIAKKGSVTSQVLELILANRGWLTDGGVRRALLANPRMTDADITKVLRAVPRHELKLLAKAGANSPKVRRAALKLLGDS